MIKTFGDFEFPMTEEVQVADWEDWINYWLPWPDDARKISALRLKVCDVHRIILHYRPHIETISPKPCIYRMLVMIKEVKIVNNNCKMI